MSAADFAGVTFEVNVCELTAGWRIRVTANDDFQAQIDAPRLDVGLEMLVPYLSALSKPVPFDEIERLFRARSAPDGPRDQGGEA